MATITINNQTITVDGLEYEQNKTRTEQAFNSVIQNASGFAMQILVDWKHIALIMHEMAKYNSSEKKTRFIITQRRK